MPFRIKQLIPCWLVVTFGLGCACTAGSPLRSAPPKQLPHAVSAPRAGRAATGVLPTRVKVLPVFFVPRDQAPPGSRLRGRLSAHLAWAQRRYRALLGTTFQLAPKGVAVVRARHPLRHYRHLPEMAAPEIVGELLTHFQTDRYSCPYIFIAMIVNPLDHHPVGGGRPINGGLNTGGGIVVLSTYGLRRSPNFQSTLQHELGHAFGLPHVDAYGYDMNRNVSIMSYDRRHHTRYLSPSSTPGRLLPEERRALAVNQRVFPGLRFTRARSDRALAAVQVIRPMRVAGHSQLQITTASGERYGSKASHVGWGRVPDNRGPGVTFRAHRMWHSAPSRSGWVTLDVRFPGRFTFTAIQLHTEHSGRYHRARAVQVELPKAGGRVILTKSLRRSDSVLCTGPVSTTHVRLRLRTGPKRQVVVRGVRFLSAGKALFAPVGPRGRLGACHKPAGQ